MRNAPGICPKADGQAGQAQPTKASVTQGHKLNVSGRNAMPASSPTNATNEADTATVRVAIELDGHMVVLSLDDGDCSAEITLSPHDAKQLANALLSASAFARMAVSTSMQ